MRGTATLAAALSCWICACTEGGGSPQEPPAGSDLTLPLEVIGAPGVEVLVDVPLTEADLAAGASAGAGAAAALVLTVHNIVEPASALVSINGGEPIDLGAAGGPLVTVAGRIASGRIAIDRSTLRAGLNRLAFQYARQVPNVSGYRVLSFGIDPGDGRARTLELAWEDPVGWAPIDAESAAIERGRAYFQDESRDGGPACARCHADSGADLVYFAFSNHSIVERAMFHEFSETEAEEIASYIRSLDVPAEGLVYDPPFQPGEANRGARGAGRDAVLDSDTAFCRAAFGADSVPTDATWSWAESADTFHLPAPVQAPTWFRWLPRDLKDEWLDMEASVDGTSRTMRDVERALAEAGTLEAAQDFMAVAVAVGKRLLVDQGDHIARIELLRFAAVKLWDWSRRNGFVDPDHGFPDAAPAYPYEVGFAFFEAALAEEGIPDAMPQVLQWWWAQLAVYPGRGLSNGLRPLNYGDVLLVAEAAGAGPCAIAFLHLYGSWEESRGEMAALWGTERGPVRLLEVPMQVLDAAGREMIMRRFLVEEAARIAAGASLSPDHHTTLSSAWSTGCPALSVEQRTSLRALAPAEVAGDLASCP